MKQTTAIAGALLLLAPLMFAQQAIPPAPSAPRQLSLPQPVDTTLPNGLRVIVLEKHDVPLVAASLMVKAGGEADPAATAGLAQLTASLVTQGTRTRSAEEIVRGIEALGATLQASAGWDRSSVELSVMSPNFANAMDFLGDVVRNPAFKKEELERLRQQSVDAIQVALGQPLSLARFVAARVVFPGEPYGHNIGGTPESLARIQREQVVSFHDRHYRPENAVFVVAGDVKPDDVTRLARATFGSWRRGEGTKTAVERARPTKVEPRVLVVDMPDAGQAAVVVTRRGLRRSDPLYFPAIVTNSVLGGGYSARLNQEIRIKRGLSYGANSSFDLRRDAGPFTAATQTKNESAAEVAGIIVDEMNRLSSGELPDSELTPRKAVLIGLFSSELETGAGQASTAGSLALYGLPLSDINRYVAGVQAIGAEDAKKFAGANLAGSSASVVIVGDAKKFLVPLRQRFGDRVEVIPLTELDLNEPGLRARK